MSKNKFLSFKKLNLLEWESINIGISQGLDLLNNFDVAKFSKQIEVGTWKKVNGPLDSDPE